MPATAKITLTSRDSANRLTAQPVIKFRPMGEESQPSIHIRDAVAYQTIAGFGGAFTESATTTLDKLPKKAQEEILHAYFHPSQGHGYTLCRSHINSCDFSLGNYAYTETPDDTKFKHFTIDRDKKSLIPAIKRAAKIAGRPLDLFASPWSPPAWMKTTNMMNRGGKLKSEYRTAWANYYARFIQEYAKAGIPIWGLTVQNEPAATQSWDSCIYTAADERDFVRDHLGPALKRAKLEDVRLMVWDHNRDLLFERAATVLDDPDAAAYVWGVAFHWYVFDCFDNPQLVHDAFPDKHLVFTEGCQEGGPHTGEWLMGERYARSVINDLNHWTEGWTDWNLLLDAAGGPNHVNNFCYAPILADTATGKILYQSSYYFLGHFARFIKPGAQRILAAKGLDDLEVTAAKNPDGTIAVVIMNRTENPISFNLKHGSAGVPLRIPHRSIMTITYKP